MVSEGRSSKRGPGRCLLEVPLHTHDINMSGFLTRPPPSPVARGLGHGRSGLSHVAAHRLVAARSASQKSGETEEFMPPGVTEENKGRIARYSAKTSAKREIVEKEGQRPVSEYMALPVSQYSVLDAAKIERLSENTFKCYVGDFTMFGVKVEPILTVSVIANERGCSIDLLDCELDGSDVVRAVNGVFATRMSNTVSLEQLEGRKLLTSDCHIEVVGISPRYMKFVPTGLIETVGNTVMQQIVAISVPRFLKQLEQDYQNWASGDDSRGAVGTGQWGELNIDGGSGNGNGAQGDMSKTEEKEKSSI